MIASTAHKISMASAPAVRSKTLYYYAYGSNLNIDQFGWRCHGMVPIARCHLPDYKLAFRGVATIIPAAGSKVAGAIYKITGDDERELDRYEGWPRLYRKEYFTARVDGAPVKVMVYLMNGGEIDPPNPGYFKCIEEGFIDWNLDQSHLQTALDEARAYWQEQRMAVDEHVARAMGSSADA